MLTTNRTFKYIYRLLKILPNKRRTDLISLIPVAIFSGIADVFVVFLVVGIFSFLINYLNCHCKQINLNHQTFALL